MENEKALRSRPGGFRVITNLTQNYIHILNGNTFIDAATQQLMLLLDSVLQRGHNRVSSAQAAPIRIRCVNNQCSVVVTHKRKLQQTSKCVEASVSLKQPCEQSPFIT